TALAWDVTGLAGKEPKELAEKDLQARWADLAGADAARAYDAAWRLITVPKQAVPFLARRLRPVAADPNEAARLIAELDSKGVAGARLTEEARASHARLARRLAPSPAAKPPARAPGVGLRVRPAGPGPLRSR